MILKPHPVPRSRSNIALVGADVERVRNQFLLGCTLREVTDALGWVKDAPHAGVLDLAAGALLDAQESLLALGAKAPKELLDEIKA